MYVDTAVVPWFWTEILEPAGSPLNLFLFSPEMTTTAERERDRGRETSAEMGIRR